MKRLHRESLFSWSAFDEARDLDFNSYLWVRDEGNVVVDPLSLSAHDRAHLAALGGAAWVVVTNSDHVRAAAEVVQLTGAQLAGPSGERDTFPLPCARWLGAGDVIAGAEVLALEGSKTPGELALVVEGDTLITGDLVRSHRGGQLDLLPDAKLADPAAARRSLEALAQRPFSAVLVGDGWPVFRDGSALLGELLARA